MESPMFSNSEFMRMQASLANMQGMVKQMQAELAYWKPAIEVEAAPEVDGVRYICRYSDAGFQEVLTAEFLAAADPEALAAAVKVLATKSAELKIKSIGDMIRSTIQKAADYAGVVQKGK